jgi:hypothetical protein
MIIDQENWNKFFKGFSIVDCAIRSRDMYVFVLSENEPKEDVWPRVRFLMVFADEPFDSRFWYTEVGDFQHASIPDME